MPTAQDNLNALDVERVHTVHCAVHVWTALSKLRAEGGREGGREVERGGRERHRQTERQTDRQKERCTSYAYCVSLAGAN